MRSAFRPSGSSDQRIISHDTTAMPASDTVYTFSFTTDWFHTVNAVAPSSVAIDAPRIRCQRAGNQPTSTRSVTRNHIAAATAEHSAARTLIRDATLAAIGSSAKTRPIRTKSGLPGGWGRPSVNAAEMYSLVSHMAVDGDSVARYSTKTHAAATEAAK